MVRMVRRLGPTLLASALVGLLAGCFGGAQNPSYFPYLLPAGDIIRTHAKPPGLGYFANFDPHARRIEVRPLDAANPVQTQHVLIATIYDERGQPRRKRRVEWMLEGVGNIVEVDESGYSAGRGYKNDNKYAVSYTDFKEHHITRGNADPNDDFVIRPGQTWCVITAAVEGDTHVTVYAPEIADWNKNKVVVTKHWIDAEWTLPPPGVSHAGAEHVLTTHVFRHTDRQPLTNYRVRYRILDGPPAVLLPTRAQEAVATSDLNGNASAGLVQASPQPGVNRIGVEIIRPPDPCSPSGAGIVIGKGETIVEWQAPAVGIVKAGPPSAALGQEMIYRITVANTGKVELQTSTVRDTVPEGLEYLRSEPPAVKEGNQLTWTLGSLQPGQERALQAVFRATRLGQATNCTTVSSDEGIRAEHCTTTQITTPQAPQLTVAKTGPAGGVVGVPITYQITVSNPGTGPAANVQLSDGFDPGLEHDTKANPVELQLGTLGPGETRTVPLNLTPQQAGRFVNRVTAMADGNLSARAEHAVVVQRAPLTISMTGPSIRYMGTRPATWVVRVTNEGEVPLTNVAVRDQLPSELAFVSASEGGQPAAGQVVWNLGTLQPHEQRQLQLRASCLRLARRALHLALASADGGLQAQTEAAVEIDGLPAFRCEALDIGDPAQVGGKLTYKIDVTNTGSLPGNQMEIVALVPPQMRVLRADGPPGPKPRFDGQRVIFPALDGLLPGRTFNYSIDVEALQPGVVIFRAELRSLTLGETPVIEEELTTIVPPGNGPARPPAAVPGPAPLPPR